MANTATSNANDSVRLPQPTLKTVLEPVRPYDTTKLHDERTQTFRKLIQEGHSAVAPLRNPQLILHSHLPHLVGSAYALGAGIEQLKETYDHIIKTLAPIDETFVRGGISLESSWREHLQDKAYTIAFVDLFDEETHKNGGDWKKVVEKYLFSGNEPVVNGFLGGLAHPVIHLAYAYEFQMEEIAAQGLSLACTEYANFHKLIDNEPSDNSTYKTNSLLEVLLRVKQDNRFDGVVKSPGTVNYDLVLKEAYDATTEHWNAWQIGDAAQTMEHICDASVLVALGSGYPEFKYDFFYAHILTAAHAYRVLLPNFSKGSHLSLLRQYGLYTILIYVLQFRREVNASTINEFALAGRDWNWVTENALRNKWAIDEHFFKVVRGLRSFADTYGEKDGFYLKAAVKFVSGFKGWEGFGEGVMGFLPSRDGIVTA
ncbi:hypothetical protein GQ53DRAFT_639786 [Thozetella sp. PMI_491]|nr:hypothetical protein GQ53DRAFT_639786 [Thozetella sp. PMI_491]